MKIVVTGAAGFIGSHVAQAFHARGHQVAGIDNFADYYSLALKRLNADELQTEGIAIHARDLAADPLDDLLPEVEVVIHAAAQPGISASTPFEAYVRNNLMATHRLLDAARKHPSLACFVNVSTSSVYGRYATVPETAEPRPTSYYGVTKLAAEQLALAYHREHGFPACSLRLFSVYGPRERPEKLYTRLIRSILEDRPFPLYAGSPEHSRSFTYIDDAVAAFLAVVDQRDRCSGEIFNIGSDLETRTADGIRIVEEIIGRKAKLAPQPGRPGDQQRTHADIGKARRMLGYAPVTPPEEGLRRQVAWYKERIWGKIVL
jgi:nucleoside-diphosphate-sugar epimerase